MKPISFLLSIVLFSAVVAAQPPLRVGVPESLVDSGELFTSIEGGFRIRMGVQIRGFKGLRLAEANNLGTGALYPFERPDANYQIGYISLVESLDRKEIVSKLKSLHEVLFGEAIPDLSIKESVTKTSTVFELHSQTHSDLAIRYELTNDKVFVLIAKLKSESSMATVKRVFDSFEIIDTDELIAEMVENSTPAPLPQSPFEPRLSTDWEEKGLRGSVKTVTEFSEDLTGQWYSTGKKKNFDENYSRDGNLVKSLRYDYRGMPTWITVYGFIDKRRVSKEATITHKYDPPLMAIPGPQAPEKPVKRDLRFETRYEYKYDDKDRLIETLQYDNAGELDRRETIGYAPNTITETSYDSEDNWTFRSTVTTDSKGFPVKETYERPANTERDAVYEYTYQEFDAAGNWTKRTTMGIERGYGGRKKVQHYIKYRIIEYFER